MDEKQLRDHIFTTVMAKFDEQNEEKRKEALYEFMALTKASSDATAEQVADIVPPVMRELYERWTGMFVDRLLETAPRDALALLCDGTAENSAALVLAYIMFMESARMEEQVDADLKEYGEKMSGADDMGDLAADYIRANLARIAAEHSSKKQ